MSVRVGQGGHEGWKHTGSAGEVGGAGSLQGLSLKLRNLHFILND